MAIKTNDNNWQHIQYIKIYFQSQKFFLYFVSHEIPNLLLQNKSVRASAPNILNSVGENQWALLRNAHHVASKKPFSSFKVPLFYQIRTYFKTEANRTSVRYAPLCEAQSFPRMEGAGKR